jgi:CheY-like chemotaxis protein
LLIVDDDATVRSLLEHFTRQEGYAVWSAEDGQQALDVYRQHGQDIHLILLDVRMPGLDGPATLTALQQINTAVRCCFISGAIAPYTHDDLLARGAVEVLAKPFMLAELSARLRELLAP